MFSGPQSIKGASRAPAKRQVAASGRAGKRRTRYATAALPENTAIQRASAVSAKAPSVVDEEHPTGSAVHADSRVLFCGSFPPVKRSIRFFYPNPNNDMWKVLGLVFYDDADAFYSPVECTSSALSLPHPHPSFKSPRSGTATRALDEARILRFAGSQPIGFFDTCRRVRRHLGNSADSNVEVLERTDVVGDVLLHAPQCAGIITTGTLALTMLLHSLAAHGTFRTSTGVPVEVLFKTRQGKYKYNIPPIGGRLEWLPSEACAFRNALWIHRGPSTSRALPLKLEDKTMHYRRAVAAHLSIPLVGAYTHLL
ncbi:hypothetical protein JKF63_02389 [Porcisia hertigi]|uniref:Uncharacterized protein n=1 Tax=Porcisia hertigi TaxID=2761500 RepID=A0A836IEX6_9TRYP|nr:hypothetical protein JKF63_02389 [Porcisia hertigi]